MIEHNGLQLYSSEEVAGLKRFGHDNIAKGEKYCEQVPRWIYGDEPMYTINVAEYDIQASVVFKPYIPFRTYQDLPARDTKQEHSPISILSDDATEEELTMYLFHVRSSLKQWQRNHKDSLLGKNAIYAIKAACNTAASGLELSNWVYSVAVGAVDED
jgi:hypothetical protein